MLKIMEKFNCIIPEWHEISQIAKNTCDVIKKSDFHPDIIIALSRGGLVPARLFCDFLHIKNCLSIKIDHWGLTATKDGEAKLTQGLNTDLSGKKVLVVDDITDTGQSMELAKKHLDELNPKEIKTATLFHLIGSKYIPDFFGTEREWTWIIFPWNYREDMVNIIKKITTTEEKNLDQIKDELKTNFNIDSEIEEIKEIIEHISYLDKL